MTPPAEGDDRARDAGLERVLRVLDADGNPVSVLEGRMVGVSLEQLQRIPTKVVVAGGQAKQRAVLAALRAGLVDILVTDVETARFALANA